MTAVLAVVGCLALAAGLMILFGQADQRAQEKAQREADEAADARLFSELFERAPVIDALRIRPIRRAAMR